MFFFPFLLFSVGAFYGDGSVNWFCPFHFISNLDSHASVYYFTFFLELCKSHVLIYIYIYIFDPVQILISWESIGLFHSTKKHIVVKPQTQSVFEKWYIFENLSLVVHEVHCDYYLKIIPKIPVFLQFVVFRI